LKKLNIGQTIPFSFFDSQDVTLTNYAIGDVVLESRKIPEGFTGIVKDNDTVFTTPGGSVDYVIKRAAGGSKVFRNAVSSDDSGFINKNLRTGDRIQIILNATGVGVLDLVWDGILKKISEVTDESGFEEEEDF